MKNKILITLALFGLALLVSPSLAAQKKTPPKNGTCCEIVCKSLCKTVCSKVQRRTEACCVMSCCGTGCCKTNCCGTGCCTSNAKTRPEVVQPKKSTAGCSTATASTAVSQQKTPKKPKRDRRITLQRSHFAQGCRLGTR